MGAPVLVAFLAWPWEGPCAPNTAQAMSKPHFALVKKVPFWVHFGVHLGACWAPLGLMLAIFVPKVGKIGFRETVTQNVRKKGRRGIPSNLRNGGGLQRLLWQAGNRDLPQAWGSVETPGAQ